MEQDYNKIQWQRAADLITLARAIYNATVHENSAGQLEVYRHLALTSKELFDQQEEMLHPDLGLELLLFIELKRDNSNEAETDRKYILGILESLENRYKI